MKTKFKRLAALGLAGTAVVWTTTLAGPLNPPAGPIVPTGKTTQEIFDKVGAGDPRTPVNTTSTPGNGTAVFRITAPGSYYLTGNVAGSLGKHGITIEADNVTLDLNGFAVEGVVGSLSGIASPGGLPHQNITIRNGVVRGWGQQGVLIVGSSVLVGNLVTSVIASENGLDGISVGGRAIVRDCTSHHNGGDGFHAGAGTCDFLNCSALSNTGDGIDSAGGLVTNCVATSNAGNGYRIGSVHITGCVAQSNTVDGYTIFTQCRVDGNTAIGNAVGFRTAGSGALIINNAATGNTTEYSLVTSSNTCGPIVTAATIATSTSPVANFDY